MQKLLRFMRLGRVGFVLVLCLALVHVALGQTDTGQVNGTVTDPTGAVVVGAKVVAKSSASGAMREAETNSAGVFTFPGLKPGTYEVTVSSSGFETIVRRMDVTVGSTMDASIRLKVGNATTTVEVVGTSDANSVNTENQTMSQTITEQQLTELPTSPTRNPYALVATSGNVTEDMQSNRGAGFAINGMRSASTDILLDGAENVDTFTATVGQTVPLDSVQEFTVLTNNFGAEYGRASGGVVNLVTKSGTNAFHGSAYEYNRVSALSSNTEYNDSTIDPTTGQATKKGVFTRNDFGFALGGPVKKDKLFFFNNTEWIRVRSAAPTSATIIDPASIPLLAPASQAFFSQYGKLVSGVTTLQTGPCSSAVVGSPTCDLVQYSVPADAGGGNPQNTWMEVARVDWTINSTTSFYARYAAYNDLDFPGVVNASPYAGYDTGQKSFDQNYDFSLSHFFTQTLANTFKVTFNRLNGPVQPLSTAPVGPTLYAASNVPSALGQPLIFPGYNEFTPGNAIPFGGPQNLYQFHDDLSWTKGRHQFKFGGQFVQLRDNRVFGAYENPTEILGQSLPKGIQNLMNGTIYQFSGAVFPQGKFPCLKDANGITIQTPDCTLTLPVGPPAFNRNYRYNDGAVYAQDAWKLTSRLTVNAGLRWEYYGPQHNANPALDSNFVLGAGSNIFDQIRNGQVKLAKDGGVFWNPQYHNFGPRVGFAYDVFGNGKTAFRAGYGISYERNFGNVTYNTIQNPPAYAVVSLVNQSVNGGKGDVPFMPVYTDTAGPLAGTGTKALPAVSQRAINQNMKTAYAESFNASIDQAVGKGVFSVSYAGSHGIHLYDIANINLPGFGTAFLGDTNTSNRLNYQYSAMNYRSDQGLSRYNALNVKYGVTNLGNKGLGITANYTFSHSLDNISSTFTDGYESNYGLGYLDAFNPRLNYGNSDFDIRHRFTMGATWDVPFLKNASNAFVRTALGGWGMGAIVNIRSGLPFSVFDSTNFNSQNYPLYAPGVPVQRAGTPTTPSGSDAQANLFNYIQIPASGGAAVGLGNSLGVPNCTGLLHVGCTYTINNAAYPDRNQFISPNFWNTDMNFYKTFKLTERFGLQFRGEFYNIFNHHNQYVYIYNLDAAGLSADSHGNLFIQTEKGGPSGFAGTPTDERRNIQFGLKLMF
jgi:outer membrane receptor protein involved in Fe transport